MGSISVFVRGENPSDRDFVSRMLSAVDIVDWELKDLNVYSLPKDHKEEVGIAFGKVCARLVQEHVTKLFVLPTPDQLKPAKENEKARAEAWATVQQLKQYLARKPDLPVIPETAPVLLKQGDKQICVYDRQKPDVQCDAFVSHDEVQLLMKIKEAFRAESITLIGG